MIDSTKANAAKLTALLGKIYGTDGAQGATGTDPQLPDPNTVITDMTPPSSP